MYEFMRAHAKPMHLVSNHLYFCSFFKPFNSKHSNSKVCDMAFDLYARHISVDVMKFREENYLVFVTFPAHTTLALQPLGGSVLGPMETKWRN
jgi:hypothetical protein